MRSGTVKNLLCALAAAIIFSFVSLCSKAIDKGYDGQTPLFVTISTNGCFACNLLDPVVEELKKEYLGQVTFVKLDVTSEDSLSYANELASNYGIHEYFNGNRYAFPRVAIFCPGGISPNKDILGYRKIEVFREVLNDILLNTNTVCNINGRPAVANNGPERPDEPQDEGAGRPEEPVLAARPLEASGSGRPAELKFWTFGQPMPLAYYFYSKTLILPECTSPDQVLCYNGSKGGKTDSLNSSQPFKPYNPNDTRDEKGFILGVVSR